MRSDVDQAMGLELLSEAAPAPHVGQAALPLAVRCAVGMRRFQSLFFSKAVLPGWTLVGSSAMILAFLKRQVAAPDFYYYGLAALLAYLCMTAAVIYVERPMAASGSLYRKPRNWRRSRRRHTAYRLSYKFAGFALCALIACLGALPLITIQHAQYRPLLEQMPAQGWLAAAGIAMLVGILLDAYDKRPWDTYYLSGRLLCQLRLGQLAEQCRITLLFSLLRGFFFAYGLLMLSIHHDYAFSDAVQPAFVILGDWAGQLLVLTDYVKIVIGTGAFLVVSRILNNHPRSVDTQPLSWLVTFACYPPLGIWVLGWNEVSQSGLDGIGIQASVWYTIYTLALSCLLLLYSADILAWGGRFSQLSYRGLVAGGPFGYLRHPAYVSKCLTMCILVVPSMTRKTWVASCAFLCVVIGLYILRAKFEERHLRKFSEYLALYRSPFISGQSS